MTAASVAVVQFSFPPGSRRQGIWDFTPSTSYPALGEPMTPASFGLLAIDDIVPSGPADGSRHVTYDPTNKTLRIFTALGTEAGTGTDQSSKVIRLVVFGI